MLQQTQVSRVIDSFNAFLKQFPTAQALADADERHVLTAWQGLGYYRRARHLHRAAVAIRDRFNGRVPRHVDDLLSLPGVGRYTAGAIASIAFHQRAPIVDGNISRVLLRILGNAAPPEVATTRQVVWAAADTLVQQAVDPAILNEGLMELGALVCTPISPRCTECPLADFCQARQLGLQFRIPTSRRPVKKSCLHHHAVVVRRGDTLLVEQRPDVGLWARMWQTPTIEAPRRLRPAEVQRKLAVKVQNLFLLARFRHETTHRRVTFHIYSARSRAKLGNWLTLDQATRLPLANPHRRILQNFGC